MATFLTFCILITIFFPNVLWVEADTAEPRVLHRQKRSWIIPPKKLFENVDYTKEDFIAKIRSDEEVRTNITYSLIGPGVDQGLFTVNPKTGFVQIHGILDREKTAEYKLKGRATLSNGELAEKDIDLNIIVLDQNDNPPVFNMEVIGSVDELSAEGTYVIVITATDADEQGTERSRISYEVVQQEPAGVMMFKVERSSGQIIVKMNTLDREAHETYKLIITGTDMYKSSSSSSQDKSLTGTGTVVITLNDVNDNIPVLEKPYYEGSVEENTINVEVMRFLAIDKDKIHTENWEAVYTIISGNEAGYFNISTDSQTNEGVLVLIKELDYELLKEIRLEVVVRNKAAYHKSVVIGKPKVYPFKIKVINVPEGPRFNPIVKTVYISEDRTTINLKKVIATYTATDSDTQLTATNIRYVKVDAHNWVTIDEKTAEIRLVKYPDYESKYLINGTYYIKILGITNDFPAKTATGTLAIQVQDFNDHCPVLTSSVETLCYGKKVMYVTAMDEDRYPNAEPFQFTVVTKETKENWNVERLNETTVILRSQTLLWPGYYTVALSVQDQQGKSCQPVQKLQVTVCTCTEAQVCQPKTRTSLSNVLGARGVLALLLGILLLLLIPVLLMLCECGGAATLGKFQAFPFEQKQQLISYHTEGQGEDKELSLLCLTSPKVDGGSKEQVGAGCGACEGWNKYGWESREGWNKHGWESREGWNKHGWESREGWNKHGWESREGWNKHGWESKHRVKHDADHVDNLIAVTEGCSEHSAHAFDYMAVSETFLGNYFSNKALDMVKEEASANQLLRFDDETCNSVTGSLEDLCDYIDDENNLDFLDYLGPQFKRLAEICCGSAIKLEASSTSMPPKAVSSSSQMGIKVEEAVGGVHSEATSVFASSSSSTTQIAQTTNSRECILTGGTTSAATVGQILPVQQPTVYLSSTPMYVVEQHHPTFLISSPTPSVQESNVVLVEKERINMVSATQNTLPRLGLQQAHTKVLVDPGIGGTVVHGFSGHPEPQGTVSGTLRVVERQRVESMEPVHVVQSFSHSSIN
ncbi:desmoglein-2-like protein [Neoarius graeffei]|uniref:desmoglein-2-like protein n=1 Tax=Neoarius graeffei TaxID=443677 RepID=UPI00298C0321|nr:desmoglein-2-like protein [Neoarius graeffei]